MKRHIVILGAGISGLSLAWFLKQSGFDITILEKSSRTGGWIHTHVKEGFLFELGPHSCRSQGGLATLQLIEQVGLQEEVIVADSAARQRYLYLDQILTPLPSGLMSLLFSSMLPGLLKDVIHDWRTPPSHLDDETIYDFIVRRFSVEMAERFIDPLTSGIYAGDIRKLSMRSCFPRLHQWEQEYGSVVKGLLRRNMQAPESIFIQRMRKCGIFSFKKGMSSLTDRLERDLKLNIKFASQAVALDLDAESVSLHTSNGETIRADHLCSTLPPSALAKLLGGENLKRLKSASVAVVNLGYRQQVLQKQGFGYLVPSKEQEDILGVIWDSSVFPQQNRFPHETRLTVMMGGSRMPHLCKLDESERLNIALQALEKHLGITTVPDVVHYSIAQDAIPQYEIGHINLLREIEMELEQFSPHLSCLGSSFHGVSINDCIAQSKKHSEILFQELYK